MNNSIKLFLIVFFGASVAACGGGGGAAAPAVTSGSLTAVTVDSAGVLGNGLGYTPAVSGDGTRIVFAANSTTLVANDNNGFVDVFLHDTTTGVTTLISVNSTTLAQANADSARPAISDDGRMVAFESAATNLVAGDTNGVSDIFLHDTVTGITTRASVDTAGVEGNGASIIASLSTTGQFVAFQSLATNLVAGDTNAVSDIFVRDTAAGAPTTTRVSVTSAGIQTAGASGNASISGDGQNIAFQSSATDLVAGVTIGGIYLHNTFNNSTTFVSRDSAGVVNDWVSEAPSISNNGNFISFASRATNLVAGDTNATWDIFRRDLVAQTTTRVSVDSNGVQHNGLDLVYSKISGDGRYVAFSGSATNLVAGDTNGFSDVFVHDCSLGATNSTIRASISATGAQGDKHSGQAAISSNGQFVAFASTATTLNGRPSYATQQDILLKKLF